MIQRAISNLMSNAIRHTPRGGSVTVRITETPDAGAGARLKVVRKNTPSRPEDGPKILNKGKAATLEEMEEAIAHGAQNSA